MQSGTAFSGIPRPKNVIFAVDHQLESGHTLTGTTDGTILGAIKQLFSDLSADMASRDYQVGAVSYWIVADTPVSIQSSFAPTAAMIDALKPEGEVSGWYANIGDAMNSAVTLMNAIPADEPTWVLILGCGNDYYTDTAATAIGTIQGHNAQNRVGYARIEATGTIGGGNPAVAVRDASNLWSVVENYADLLSFAQTFLFPPTDADAGYIDTTGFQPTPFDLQATGIQYVGNKNIYYVTPPGEEATGSSLSVATINAAIDEPASDTSELNGILPNRFECRITSFAGDEYYGIPGNMVENAEWYYEQQGGYGSFTLTVSADDSANSFKLFNIPSFARVEFFVDGICRYRGFITKPALIAGQMNKYQFSGFGLLALAGENTVRVNRAYDTLKDISEIAADVASTALQNTYEGLQITANNVGVTAQKAIYRDKSVKDAFSDLANHAAGSMVWGFYHSEADLSILARPGVSVSNSLFSRPNTLLFSPVGSLDNADHFIMVPSTNVTASQGEPDWTRVKNLVNLTGGTRTFPNLLYNADFRIPVNSGSGLGNLVNNGDFEHGNDFWTAISTGSFQLAGGAKGQAFTGGGMWELDHIGEGLNQTFVASITPGTTYNVCYYYRLQQQQQSHNLHTVLKWNLSDGSTITAVDDSFLNNQAAWTYKEYPIVAPFDSDLSGRTILSLEFTVTMAAGGSNIGTSFIDSVQFYDTTERLQDGWWAFANNGAHNLWIHDPTTTAIQTQNWIYPDCPSITDSGYSLYLKCTASDVDGGDVCVEMRGGARYQHDPGEELLYIIYLKNSPFSANSPIVQLQMEGFKGDGSSNNRNRFTIPADALTSDSAAIAAGGTVAGNGWYMFQMNRLADGDEVGGTIRIAIRSNGELLIGPQSVRNITMTGWCPDGPLYMRLRSDDTGIDYASAGVPTDTITAIQNSIATYGPRETNLNVPALATDGDAYTYMAYWFAENSLPEDLPRITLIDQTTQFFPGESVYIAGSFGASFQTRTFHIARIRERWTSLGSLETDLELGKEVKDEAGYFVDLIDRKLQSQQYIGGAGVSVGAASPATGGGGSNISGPAYWGLSARTDTDSTLHDAYAPDGGPHLTTAQIGLLTDVLNANVSTENTTTYANIKARFEAIETQVNGITAVAITFLGAWSSSTAYVVGNVVSYNGSSWYCILANTNQTPADVSTYWSVLAHEGDAGATGPTGPAGATGPAGTNGANGATWYSGSGAPSSGTGSDGDYYLNTANGNVYQKSGGSWGSSIGNLTGPTGPTGSAGTNGATWTSGTAVPSGGNDGDFYFRTTTSDVYERTAGTWSIIANIQGATGAMGATGPAGTNGTNGNTITSGTGAPSGGVDGDFYINTSTWDVSKRISGTWTVIGNIKGATGATGAAGSNGTNGTNGSNGTNGNTLITGTTAPSSGTGMNGDSYINLATWDFYVKSAGAWILQGNIAATAAGVTSIIAGTGLSGGTITSTGTIAIAAGGVGTTQLADGSVTGPKLAGNSVTTTNIVDNSITSAKIVDGTIQTADIGNNQVTTAQMDVTGAAGTYTNANITVDAAGRITAAANGVGGTGINTARQTLVTTMASLAPGVAGTANITLQKGAIAYVVTTDYPAWVRVYATSAALTADASRAITSDPTGNSRMLLETIHSATYLEVDLTPGVILYNLDSTVGTTLYLSVTNEDSVSRVIHVSITYVQIET